MAKEAYNKYGFFPLHPEDARVNHYPIKTGQTLAAGDPVILDSGQIAVAVSNSSTELIGVVARDCASLTAATLVPVWDDPDTIFKCRASADASSLAVGTARDLTGTTGAFQLNVAAGTQSVVLFMGCLPAEDSSQAGAYCRARIAKHGFADISS
jgi:hypothetical protein